ncbi:MAG: NrsF family protein [Hyphomicrobiales bacterium]|nr:NrsF family protein [Hyphomicrobiales bacterium]
MRTDDLIDALARQGRPPEPSVGRVLRVAQAFGFAASAMLFMAILGPRADGVDALFRGWYGLKLVLVGGLAAAAFPVAEALARPGARPPAVGLMVVAAALVLAAAVDIALLGADGAASRLLGRNGLHCMSLVPLLAAAPFAAALIALRRGAPTRPGLAGAAAGLLSGALGALLYGVFCPDDSPLFVAFWYTLAIGLVTALGVLAGRLFLRW